MRMNFGVVGLPSQPIRDLSITPTPASQQGSQIGLGFLCHCQPLEWQRLQEGEVKWEKDDVHLV